MKRVFLLFLGLLCLAATQSAAAQSRYSKARLSDDLDTLYYIIRESHPDLFFVLPQPEFEYELEQVRNSLTDSMTRLEFYALAAPLIVRLGDGHTAIWLPEEDFNETRILPYAFDIDARSARLTVRHDLSGAETPIPSGAQVFTINGKSVPKIIEELLPLVSGESDLFRMQFLARNLSRLHYIHYGDTLFRIEYDPDQYTPEADFGSTEYRTQPGIGFAEYRNRLQQADIRNDEKPYSLSIDEENRIAIIDLRAFVYDPDEARAFLDSTFSLLREKGITDLIIDVRNNGGGDSLLGDEFFQYISPVPFGQFGTVRMKYGEPLARYDHVPDLEVGKVYTYEQSEEEDIEPLRENPLRYSGNTYLLTSSYTFSSATDFSWAFQYFGMGPVIGEETGGQVVGFGDALGFTLPHTELRYGVSFKEFYTYGATDQNRHGTRPDYPVPADRAMEKAYELIEASR